MIDCSFRIFNQELLKKKFSNYVVGIDLGGTSTNIAVAGIEDNKPFLLFSLDFRTKELESLIPAIQEALTYSKSNYDIDVKIACVGAAGVVSDTNKYAELTNVEWNVSTEEIINNTDLESIFIINDFQAIGYGINLLDTNNSEDILIVRDNNISNIFSTKAVIGAGTGFGKSILHYDENTKAHIPISSEGGHSDFPSQNSFEIELIEHIKNKNSSSEPLYYEELLSGRGIENIYYFLKESGRFEETGYSNEIDASNEKSILISNYKLVDPLCKETFRLFTRFYGRCAKNFALDSLATGGIYIAGGIASKNKEIFMTSDFFEEFENSSQRRDILKEIPIYVILKYDVSLYGACFAAMCHSQKR